MRGCRRIAGEIGKHRAALLNPGVAIGFTEHGLGAWLVQARMVQELATMVRIVCGGVDRPACDCLGQAHDIVLVVAGAHAEGVKL